MATLQPFLSNARAVAFPIPADPPADAAEWLALPELAATSNARRSCASPFISLGWDIANQCIGDLSSHAQTMPRHDISPVLKTTRHWQYPALSFIFDIYSLSCGVHSSSGAASTPCSAGPCRCRMHSFASQNWHSKGAANKQSNRAMLN